MRSADDWFLYNCRYAAAWTSEIEDGQPLARTSWKSPLLSIVVRTVSMWRWTIAVAIDQHPGHGPDRG